MKRFLFVAMAVAFVAAFCAASYAEQVAATTEVTKTCVATTTTSSSGYCGKFKLEGYGEYISFMGGDINHGTWGGGILARYMFLDWLGAQTNFSFYSKCKTDELPGDLEANNWRLTLLAHAYAPDIDPKLYGYVGAGLGVQFNNDISPVTIKDPLTGHVLFGIGYEFTETLFVEGEVGYQFGKADTSNFKDADIGVEALFVRVGAGVKF